MQSHHADDLYTSISFMKKPVTKKNGKRRHCDIMYLQKSLTKSVAWSDTVAGKRPPIFSKGSNSNFNPGPGARRSARDFPVVCQLGCQVVKSCLLTTFHLLRNFASSLQCKFSRSSEPLKMSSRLENDEKVVEIQQGHTSSSF